MVNNKKNKTPQGEEDEVIKDDPEKMDDEFFQPVILDLQQN
jgi:hypothetical protein